MQQGNENTYGNQSNAFILALAAIMLVGLWSLIASQVSAQTQSGSIMGMKWHDADGDGNVPYGSSIESGLPGWTIYLDLNNDGHLNDGEPRTVTDTDGDYKFENLAAGFYTVREVGQAGWEQVFPANAYHSVEIKSDNLVIRPIDFGNRKIENVGVGAIHGIKWDDKDGDGKLPSSTSNESGLPGWIIYLDLNNNSSLDSGEPSVVTNSSGNYSFFDLAPGTYIVREVLQDGWKQIVPASGSYNLTISTQGTSVQTHLGIDFGNQMIEGQGGSGGGGGGGTTTPSPTPSPSPSPTPSPSPSPTPTPNPAPNPAGALPPPGQVLGESTEADMGGGEELPRTGLSSNLLFILGLLGLGYILLKK